METTSNPPWDDQIVAPLGYTPYTLTNILVEIFYEYYCNTLIENLLIFLRENKVFAFKHRKLIETLLLAMNLYMHFLTFCGKQSENYWYSMMIISATDS